MSQRVLFNGAVLVRPGGYTKIDASGFLNVTLGGVGIVGLVGEADGGQPQVLQTFRNAAAVKTYYRSGPLVEAAQIAFNPGNDPRIPGGATLVVCVKVNGSTQSTLNLAGAGGLANVTGVGITVQGTPGTTAYSYAVVAVLNTGVTAAVGAAVAATATGAATLTGVNFNRIAWTTVAGAQSYRIYRVTSAGSPSTLGYIGAVLQGTLQFDDTGLAADGTTAPSTNTTGTAIVLTSRDYGRFTNNISAQVTAGASANGRVITLRFTNNGQVSSQTSPSVGDTGKFTLQYTGAGTAPTVTVTQGVGAKLTTAVTGAPADPLDLPFANFATLADLITAINATGKYVATALITNSGAFSPLNLDSVAAVSITTTTPLYASKFDLVNWINQNSQLVSAANGATPSTASVMAGPVYLTGGYHGVTSNSNFVNGISLLGSLRVNQVVALASKDGTYSEIINGSPVVDTYTALSVAAAVEAHCAYYSSTQGKSEREGWIGLHATQAAIISEANLLNSPHVVVMCQQITLFTAADNSFIDSGLAGSSYVMPEWATAVALAGMRAGAPLGEPLTWKYVRAFGLTQTNDWTVFNNAEDMILNGVTILENVTGKGIRVMKCITTYTRDNNDAYTEESVVQGWKNIAYEWRTALEDRYTGRPGLIANVQTVIPYSQVILSALRDQGQIADSFVNGVVIPGYRDITADLTNDVLEVSGTVSPVQGINFTLNTIFIQPAQISL